MPSVTILRIIIPIVIMRNVVATFLNTLLGGYLQVIYETSYDLA
jgi:hypothetical protein